MFCTSYSFLLRGIDAVMIAVEADVSNGLPGFDMVGYLSSEVREAKERVRVAVKNQGFQLPARKITVNLSPADVRKDGTQYDLAVAVAILGGFEHFAQEVLKGVCFVGELSLDGQIKKVPGILPCVLAAKERGFQRIFVPYGNAQEGAFITGIEICGVKTLNEVITKLMDPSVKLEIASAEEVALGEPYDDFADISGQYLAKRAAEIAAAGKHNLLLIGPPGAGKTMLAKRIPGILPSISFEEQIEVTKIYSVAGLLKENGTLIQKRPFRAPHHSITTSALTGGGMVPKPGEISLASHGILFLDEFPEFRRSSIEALRQPLEDRIVCISRLHQTTVFPASFSLVAAMNPCPCGCYPDRTRCHCTEEQVRRYRGKLSRPILDRIDLCADMPALSLEELENEELRESSCVIRERVERARKLQEERYQGLGIHFNSELKGSMLEEYCVMSSEAREKLRRAFTKRKLSMRAYHRITRVARTIADLAGSRLIDGKHLGEAIFYHTLDEKYQGER